MAVIRGPSVRLWFENCAENRKHCHERGAWGEIRGGKLASLAYYGSRYYRGARGISSAREVAEEFSFGTSIVAMRGGEREREREREREKGEKYVRRNWIPAIFCEPNAITCALHLIKRNGDDVALLSL